MGIVDSLWSLRCFAEVRVSARSKVVIHSSLQLANQGTLCLMAPARIVRVEIVSRQKLSLVRDLASEDFTLLNPSLCHFWNSSYLSGFIQLLYVTLNYPGRNRKFLSLVVKMAMGSDKISAPYEFGSWCPFNNTRNLYYLNSDPVNFIAGRPPIHIFKLGRKYSWKRGGVR